MELKTSDLAKEIERLNEELVENLRAKPVDFVVELSPPEPSVIKPLPPESPSQPLEILCQDLQSDLTKYKRIIDKLKQEKTELKSTLEGQGIQFSDTDLEELKKENESLKNDLNNMQKSISKGKNETVPVDTSQFDLQITNLENKLREKESEIADLKLSAISPTEVSGNPMAELIENLQKNINKLKTTINVKDKKILDLNKRIAQM
jgi:DNA repair exonuclease SbcCD ATPase subunit